MKEAVSIRPSGVMSLSVFDRVRSTNDVLDQGVIIWVVHMGRAGVHCP
jgi:hypothetical protein